MDLEDAELENMDLEDKLALRLSASHSRPEAASCVMTGEIVVACQHRRTLEQVRFKWHQPRALWLL